MKRIVLPTSLAVAGVVTLFCSAPSFLARQSPNVPDRQQAQSESAPSPAAKETLRKLLEGKKTYRVGYTPALERKTAELFGVEIPKDEPQRARRIHTQQERAMAELGQRQETYLKSHPGAQVQQNSAYERIIKEVRAQHPRRPITTRLSGVAQLLTRFDWANHVQFNVRDQGESCGNCWAFASIAAFESVMQLQAQVAQFTGTETVNGQTVDLPRPPSTSVSFSVQSLINCIRKDKADCQGGWHGSGFAHLVEFGAAPVSGLLPKGIPRVSDQYIGNKLPCESKPGVRAITWDYVNLQHPDQPPSVMDMKIALMEHGPLAALVIADDAFKAYLGGVFNEHRTGIGNHAILITGWDDEKKAWRILNSWGEKWGEQGFMWIAWDSNNIGQWAAWVEAPITFPN